MLHVLNLILVVVLLPVLTSSFPQSNRWKEMYDRLQAGYPARQNPLPEDRGVPLRRVLEELSHLEREQRALQTLDNAAPSSLLAPPSPALLAPGTGGMGGEAQGSGVYGGRKREELLAKLLAAGRAMPALLPSAKRGGFVGAPGSAGGPNIFGR